MMSWMQEIEQEYGLNNLAWESCSSDPFSNESYKLSSSEGRDYFLKAHSPEKSQELLEQEFELIEKLRSADFNLIPHTIPSKNGALFCFIENRFYSLHNFIKGDPPYSWLAGGWSTSQSNLAGHILAALHTCGKKILTEENLKFKDNGLLLELPTIWLTSLSKLEPTIKHKQDSLLFAILQNRNLLTARLEKALQTVKDLHSKTSAETIIHGDFHPGNLIFSGEKVQAVIDFDYARKGRAEYDLAYAILMFKAKNELPETESLLNSPQVSSFFKGYAAGGGHCQKEILESWIEIAAFVILAWLIDRLYQDTEALYAEEPAQWLLSFLSRSR